MISTDKLVAGQQPYRPRHAAARRSTAQPLASGWLGRALALLAAVAVMATLMAYYSSRADAATAKRLVAMKYALSQSGDHYRYGGTGPSSWDCSGLVMVAYRKAGVKLPRTSGDQRRTSRTVHVSRYKAKRGDLVFWGTGHVELLDKVYRKNGRWYTRTFGAHSSGTRVSYRTVSGVPHIEHVRGAG